MTIYALDENYQKVEVEWPDVLRAVAKIDTFFKDVEGRFVERDNLIVLLKYAMLLQEHVLIYGIHGTGKTAVADTIIKNISGARFWSHDFSKFTVDTHVYGNFDLKKAQDTGQFHHQTEGSLLEANFANLGEFLDGSIAVLRSLLRTLNEREFLRGPQHLKVPLMTAIANTNLDPTQQHARSTELAAVLDRFMFWHNIEYVKSPENRMLMLKSFLERKHDGDMAPLSLEDVRLVSGVILQNNLLTNEYILAAYEQLTREFSIRRGYPISDRRLNKASQIMEASAILSGAQQVTWSDLNAVRHALVDREEHNEIFDELLERVIERWTDKESKSEIDKEVQALDALASTIPRVDFKNADSAELVDLNKQFRNLKHRLFVFNVTTPKAAGKKQEMIDTLDGCIKSVMALINGTN